MMGSEGKRSAEVPSPAVTSGYPGSKASSFRSTITSVKWELALPPITPGELREWMFAQCSERRHRLVLKLKIHMSESGEVS